MFHTISGKKKIYTLSKLNKNPILSLYTQRYFSRFVFSLQQAFENSAVKVQCIGFKNCMARDLEDRRIYTIFL